MKEVSVIIPAYNEAGRIGETIRAVRGIAEVEEILVVDDASSDQTTAEASAAGARVVRQDFNQGKGAALSRGIREARGDILVLLDADLGASAAEARKLILPILAGKADLTVARFPRARRKGGFGLVKGLARRGIRYFTGLEMESPISGQRALRKNVAPSILPLAPGFGAEVAMTIAAARAGLRVQEVPTNMTHRETGRDLAGFWHRGRQFADIARTLWHCYRRYGPRGER
ncbi:MAG: glycosyltransferase family 2 protein [Bacillota bacterium]|nr:glycosyltransferase family 2 protein [Bacillota bacterium]